MDRHAAAVRAPNFPAGLPWVNSPPVDLNALLGKIVILDFWTFG